tara:strand:+ start:102 stop:575 length:474 start_codon:yes stop_codon:yes gene_type:complete
MKFKFTILYIILIVAVNYGFSVVPLVPVLGEMFPPMSLIVGFIFVARDYAQREINHKVIFAMLLAAVLSYLMADPFVALASLAAFTFSELADWGVYSFTKKPFYQRVLLSSILASPIDSFIFLALIGQFSIIGASLMTASKIIGALVVWGVTRESKV